MKLTLKKVRYQNLLATGNAFIEINLTESPTTLVVGKNGEGKSTFMDAITFALFNKAFRNINKNQLVNSINKKNLVVELEFSNEKHEYLIRRGIKPALFEIFQDGNLINQNADSRDYQEVLETQILKLNYRTFTQTVVVGSATYVPFMQLVSQHRREIIEDLLDIQVFSVMNVLLKGKVTDNKDLLTSVNQGIELRTAQLDGHKKAINSVAENNKVLIDQLNQKLDDTRDSIVTDESQLVIGAIFRDELTDQIGDLEAVNKFIEKADGFIRKAQFENEQYLAQIKFFAENHSCPTCTQDIGVKLKTTTITSNQQKIDANYQLLKTIDIKRNKKLDRLVQIQKIIKQIQTLNQERKETSSRIAANFNYIQQISDQVIAIKAQTTVTEQDATLIQFLEEELAQLYTDKETVTNLAVTYQTAASLLKDNGIKTKIIKQYIPIINKLINKYLAAMDFFVNFELDESFNETIKSRHRDDFAYNSFSEGEKFRIDLAIMFTWRAICKLRNTTNINLLVLDELFDSSLDGPGTEEFLKIIKALKEDANVFVISHKTDQLSDQFSNIITFQKHKNFSTMNRSHV